LCYNNTKDNFRKRNAGNQGLKFLFFVKGVLSKIHENEKAMTELLRIAT